MKSILLPFLALSLLLPNLLKAQAPSGTQVDNLSVYIRGPGNPFTPPFTIGANCLADLNAYPIINTYTPGTIKIINSTNGPVGFTTNLVFTRPTATRTITFPDATGTVLTSAASQTLTTPVIAGGLTATGAGSVNFSGSTASFLFPTGGVLANYVAVNAGGSTIALTAAQSGQTVNLDTATGTVVTLPTPVAGLFFNFQVTVSVTSNSHEIKTSAGTIFMQGVVAQIGSATTFGFKGDASTHVCLKMNGTTTGGLLGSQFTVTCLSATQWLVSGINVASGTAATPFNATP